MLLDLPSTFSQTRKKEKESVMKTKSFFFLQLALFFAVFFPKALFSFPITPPNILPSSHYRNDPQTMYPYIHGDLFRAYSDFVIDEGLQPIDPEKVKKGDIIFLRAEWLDFFFSKVHPLIKEKYILLTHNEFNNVDLPGKWVCYLDEQKLAGWFGKSLGIPNHLKAFPLPLGIKNVPRRYQEQPLEKDKQRLLLPLKKATLNLPTPKVNLLYINFSLCTEERVDVMHFFKKKPFTYFAEKTLFFCLLNRYSQVQICAFS